MSKIKTVLIAIVMTVVMAGAGVAPVYATNGSTVASTGEQVVKNAFSMKNYVYWYGGSGQKCSYALLNTLSRLYPGIYTTTYKQKCVADIKNGKYCIDCSGFACKASGLPHYSTYQMTYDSHFIQLKDKSKIKNGMIVWRPTHCGIYYNGEVITTVSGEYVIEARGIDYDITTTRKYRDTDWDRIYYVRGINYNSIEKLDDDYDYAARMVIAGKYGNGETRKKKLQAEGFDYKRVQALVNEKLRKK